jgi:ubiquinone/menaquinone biosynthesis C-methylase UbiE
MFGYPHGVLGRLGGRIMARTNAEWGARVTSLLQVAPNDSVLEIGFGPGVVIDRLSRLVPGGRIVGIDPSPEMVEQARARNDDAIRNGRVELRQSSIERLPLADNSIDKALACRSGRTLSPGCRNCGA